MKIKLNVNAEIFHIDIDEDEVLLDTLRKIGIKSVRKGCDTGACGVCTVLLDEQPVLSCTYLTLRALDKKIVTVEGLGHMADEIVDCIIEQGADQCGYCGPALVLTTYQMKKDLINPTVEDINHYLAGNLCRCTGYQGQLRGIKKYMGVE